MELSIDIAESKNLNALRKAIRKKWNLAAIRSAPIIEQRLKKLLIDGGGSSGQTGSVFLPFKRSQMWQILQNPRILAEIGLPSLRPLEDLLEGIRSTVEVDVGGRSPKYLKIRIVDLNMIASMTIHPAAGTGRLGNISWFVDWLVNGLPVQDYRFKKTGPPKPRSSPVAGAEAGLMMPLSGGIWEFTPIMRSHLDRWLSNNIAPIKGFAFSQIKKIIGNI